ncbi:MAG: glycosyltransferase family 2 protein [Elusimicrobiota bacterium]
MRVTLFLPVRNEIAGVRRILPKIRREWVDEILAVDAHSTDGTREYLLGAGARVVDQKSRGVGGAYWECVREASGDAIIAFSPDGNSLPELIPVLADRMREGYDMVIASRYAEGARSYDDDCVTALGNRIFTLAVNLLFGGSCTDSLVMLRAFRKDLPERLGMRPSELPVFEYQLCIRCAKRKMRTLDIPGDEPPRIGDARKMRPFFNGSALLWCLAKEALGGLSPRR